MNERWTFVWKILQTRKNNKVKIENFLMNFPCVWGSWKFDCDFVIAETLAVENWHVRTRYRRTFPHRRRAFILLSLPRFALSLARLLSSHVRAEPERTHSSNKRKKVQGRKISSSEIFFFVFFLQKKSCEPNFDLYERRKCVSEGERKWQIDRS